MRQLKKAVLPINIACCALLLVLMLLDLFWPRKNIFLSEWVKLFMLLTCVLSSVNAIRLISFRRKRQAGEWWRH